MGLPGGKNEFGESVADTVVREVFEETGVRVQPTVLIPLALSHVWQTPYGALHVIIMSYHCVLLGGTPHPLDPKVNDARWVAPKDFAAYDFLPNSAPEFLAAYKKMATG